MLTSSRHNTPFSKAFQKMKIKPTKSDMAEKQSTSNEPLRKEKPSSVSSSTLNETSSTSSTSFKSTSNTYVNDNSNIYANDNSSSISISEEEKARMAESEAKRVIREQMLNECEIGAQIGRAGESEELVKARIARAKERVKRKFG